MEDLKNIIKEIQKYKQELNLNASDDTILECSTRIFNSHNINKIPFRNNNNSIPATEKQIYLMKKLKLDVPEGINIAEAKKAIEEALKKQNEVKS